MQATFSFMNHISSAKSRIYNSYVPFLRLGLHPFIYVPLDDEPIRFWKTRFAQKLAMSYTWSALPQALPRAPLLRPRTV